MLFYPVLFVNPGLPVAWVTVGRTDDFRFRECVDSLVHSGYGVYIFDIYLNQLATADAES